MSVRQYPNLQSYTRPTSLTYGKMKPVPVIEAPAQSYLDKMQVTFKGFDANDKIYYRVQEAHSARLADYQLYTKPVTLKERVAMVSFFAERGGVYSDTLQAVYYKKPNDYGINIKSKYNPQYTAGGDGALLDGIRGSENWRKGGWQGYQGQDFEAVIDLHKNKPVVGITANFLQDSRAWIVFPTKVEFYVSDDNKDFKLLKTIDNTVPAQDYTVQVQSFGADFKGIQARYIKVKAYNFGTLPEWHQGAGGEAFIFIDEITVTP